MRNQKLIIGIFDSGAGGLPVIHRLYHYLKEYKLDKVTCVKYLGDTKNFPYGTKSMKELKGIVRQNIKNLFEHGCNILGIACNTASIVYNADSASHIHPYVMPIINMSAFLASEKSQKHIHVISSTFTAKAHAYKKLVKKQNKNLRVTEAGEQEFIMAIEKNDTKKIVLHAKRIVRELPKSVDTLVLGCTHFSIVHTLFKKLLQAQRPWVTIVDPTDSMAQELCNIARDLIDRLSFSPTQEISFSGKKPSYTNFFEQEM